MVWQDTRGTWYARALREFGHPKGRRMGPYGTEAQAKSALAGAEADEVYEAMEQGGSG